jgi:hypothetical protein
MELIFKCEDCGKRLEMDKIYTIPGQEIVDPFTGLKWGTGKRLCEECYKNNTSAPIEVWKEKEAKISGLIAGSNFDKIKVMVVKKLSEEKKSKDGKELTLGKFNVKDDSGGITLTLWGSDISMVKESNVLIIENGYVKNFMNERYLTLGKNGRLTILK